MVNKTSSQSALREGSDPSTAPSDRTEKTSPTPEQFTQTSRCDTTFRESNPLIKSIDFLSSEIQENHNGKPNIIQISERISNMRKVDLACDAIESFEYIQLSDPSNIQYLFINLGRLEVDNDRQHYYDDYENSDDELKDNDRQDYYDEYENSDDESIDSRKMTKIQYLYNNLERLQVDNDKQDCYDEYANSDDESIDSIKLTRMRRLRKQRMMAATGPSLYAMHPQQRKYI